MSSAKLPPTHRFGRALLRTALWLIPLTGAATYLFARARMDALVSAAVLYHCGAGVVLGTWFVVSRRRRSQRAVVRISLVVSLATGMALITAAAFGMSTSRLPWVFAVHIAVGFIVLLGMVVLVLARFTVRRRAASPTVAAGMIIASATAMLAAAGMDYPAEDYYRRITATNPGQAGNPLFPAGTTLAGGWRSAPDSDSCGVPGCHPDVHRQWSASRHAHSGEAILGRRDATSNWCQGCHSTSTLLSDDGAGRTHAGVDCLSCHAMTDVPHPTGNGFAVFAPPAKYPFAGAATAAQRRAHAFLLRLRPAPHSETLRPARLREDANFACAPCHRMAVNLAQNQYKFLRYDNTWAEWQAGPYSRESLHAFQMSPMRRDCIDCHMPRDTNGRVDHGGQGPAARIEPNRDLRVEVFAVRRRKGGPAGSETVHAPLEGGRLSVSPNERIVFDVLVENRGIGHAFPAATMSGEDVWLSFTVSDATESALYAAPARPDASDDTAHRYGQLALDRNASSLSAAHKGQMVASAYRRFIGPGESDVAHYQLTVPSVVRGSSLTISARLVRKRAPGAGGGTEVLADHKVTLSVRREPDTPEGDAQAGDKASLAARYFAYGVGLLLQSDNGRARRMFLRASRLMPREPLYEIGAARAFLADHDLLSARASLEAALKKLPDMPEALFWLGAVHRESGQYAKGLALLTPLVKRFPYDGHLWMEIGLCRLQSGADEAAAEAFRSALAVDPDDAAAHYNLMQSRVRMRQISQARREETVFHALQDDEPLRGVLDPYFSRFPGARIESLPLHQHVLQPLRGGTP